MKRIALFALFFVFCAVFGFAQANLQPAAIINLTKREPITVAQFRVEVERMEKAAVAAGRSLSDNDKKQILNAMIDERLLFQAAERDKVTVAENEINQRIQQLRAVANQQAGRQVTDAEFSVAIRDQTGMDMSAFREQLRKQVILEKYLLFKNPNLADGIKPPTEAEILTMYNFSKSQLVRPDTVRITMIEIAHGNDQIKARELANRLYNEIGSSPSKFDEVAARAQSPNSGYQAGDIGYLPHNNEARQMVGDEFLGVAFALKQGEVSRLINGSRSYQIIKITESFSMKILGLDDIILDTRHPETGGPLLVREAIRFSLFQEKQQAALTQATDALRTELRAGKSFEIIERNLTGQGLGW